MIPSLAKRLDGGRPCNDRVERCANCEAELDPSEWHPVKATTTGAVSVVPFCEDACREAWTDDTDQPPTTHSKGT